VRSLNPAEYLLVRRLGFLPLRLIVGYDFMAHAYAKIVKGPEYFVGILHAILLVATFTVHLPYRFSSIKPQAVTAGGAPLVRNVRGA